MALLTGVAFSTLSLGSILGGMAASRGAPEERDVLRAMLLLARPCVLSFAAVARVERTSASATPLLKPCMPTGIL